MPALSISFEGAARTVTGSRHRIQFGDRQWLFDCGVYQGHREEAERINRSFRFEPADLDTVVLSHAHIDHSGNLPTLVARGYPGEIHATPATTDLCRFMLADSAFLMEKDLEHVRRHRGQRRGRSALPPLPPLYTPADVETTMARFRNHDYHKPWELFPGVTVEYFDAGHILGSALTTFEFKDGTRTFRLGMGGDLGRGHRPILRDPEVHPGVDALVLESTYGNRRHPSQEDSHRQLAEIVRTTVARGGRVIVPAFAVGRTQELVATLHELATRDEIPSLPMYVDSPMASQATQTFRRHPEVFDNETRVLFEDQGGAPFGFARLRYIGSANESRALNDSRQPCIILAASGMCEGGRILHHLQHGLGSPKNTVLFVGYQGEGTLGRRLLDGAEVVSLFGEPTRVAAEIRSLSGFSAHADQGELVAWASALRPRPKRVFLVHGEFEAAAVLAEKLREAWDVDVEIPARNEQFDLWA